MNPHVILRRRCRINNVDLSMTEKKKNSHQGKMNRWQSKEEIPHFQSKLKNYFFKYRFQELTFIKILFSFFLFLTIVGVLCKALRAAIYALYKCLLLLLLLLLLLVLVFCHCSFSSDDSRKYISACFDLRDKLQYQSNVISL